MQDTQPLNWVNESIAQTRRLIAEESFCHEHRVDQKAFTRERYFTFLKSMLFLLQKTTRSIQLHLHSFFEALGQVLGGPSASAWTQARLKLRHSAFVELNEVAIVQVVYRDCHHPQLRLWRGYRLLAIDSSLLRLPHREELGQEFGWAECSNQKGGCGRYPQARLSVLTDVLNRIGLQTFLRPWTQGERDLALEHLQRLEAWDVALLDRGFAAYELWAQFVRAERHFVCRCQASSFGIVNRLFKEDQAGRSVVVQMSVPGRDLKKVREAGLPEVLTLRFVTVRLKTGQLEVLVTNLLDEAAYRTECFLGSSIITGGESKPSTVCSKGGWI